MAKHEVIVYSTTVCPWCHKAKEFLKEHKVAFNHFLSFLPVFANIDILKGNLMLFQKLLCLVAPGADRC